MFQIQKLANLITSFEHEIDVIFGVCSTKAKPYSTRNEGGSGIGHDYYDDGCLTILYDHKSELFYALMNHPTTRIAHLHHSMKDGKFSQIED